MALLVLLTFALYLVPTPGASGLAEIGTGALMALVLPTELLGPFTLGYRALLLYLPAAVGAFVLVAACRRFGRPLGAPSALAAGLALGLTLALPGSVEAATPLDRGPASDTVPPCDASLDETLAEAEAALALDPSHAGGHHILGTLHAGAMRLGSVERFIARRFLGGDFLAEASWARAEGHFIRARDADPDDPRHGPELGVLYLDTDRPDLAVLELRRAAVAPVLLPGDSAVVARARTLLSALGESGTRDRERGPVRPSDRPPPRRPLRLPGVAGPRHLPRRRGWPDP